MFVELPHKVSLNISINIHLDQHAVVKPYSA
jgi:hypothetical protein